MVRQLPCPTWPLHGVTLGGHISVCMHPDWGDVADVGCRLWQQLPRGGFLWLIRVFVSHKLGMLVYAHCVRVHISACYCSSALGCCGMYNASALMTSSGLLARSCHQPHCSCAASRGS